MRGVKGGVGGGVQRGSEIVAIGAGKEGGHALIGESDEDEQAGLVEGSVRVDAEVCRLQGKIKVEGN